MKKGRYDYKGHEMPRPRPRVNTCLVIIVIGIVVLFLLAWWAYEGIRDFMEKVMEKKEEKIEQLDEEVRNGKKETHLAGLRVGEGLQIHG